MLSFSRYTVGAVRSAAILLFASVVAHAAVITVTPTVTALSGGLYQYAYSISTAGTNDAFLIDISVPKSASAVTNLTTPAGFKSQFDSVLGLASFLEDTSLFTSSATSGFSFTSAFAPGTSVFTASLFDSSFNVFTIAGTTLAPTAATATPEPAYFYLLAFMAPVFFFMKRRKTGISSDSESNYSTEALHVSNR